MARQSQYEYRKWIIAIAVQEITKTKGRPPALREVSERTSIPVSTIHSYLDKLVEDQVVEWKGKSHRTIRLTDGAKEEVDRRLASKVMPF